MKVLQELSHSISTISVLHCACTSLQKALHNVSHDIIILSVSAPHMFAFCLYGFSHSLHMPQSMRQSQALVINSWMNSDVSLPLKLAQVLQWQAGVCSENVCVRVPERRHPIYSWRWGSELHSQYRWCSSLLLLQAPASGPDHIKIMTWILI